VSRPKQVVPLFLGAGASWLLHVVLLVTAPAGDGLSGGSSLLLATALANLAFWLGLLLSGAALLLLVLSWDRRSTEDDSTKTPDIDYYS
jgi:hypothetical protein